MRRALMLLLVAVLALLGGCEAPAPSPPAKPPLRLAIDRWPGYYPAVLAEELGLFAEAGVAVQIALPENTDRMLAEFAAGGHDLVGVALGDLITLTRNRADVGVVLVSDLSAGGDAVLARPDFAIDPEGSVRIGTNLGGFGELFVRELLPRLGIDAQRVEWVNTDASQVPAALTAGEIDLGHCWEPYASEAEQAGARRLASSLDTPGLIPDVIAGSRHLASQRGAELRAFSVAWFRAVDWWRQHPAEAQQRIERRLGLAAGEASLRGIALQDLAQNRRLLIGVDGGRPELLPVIDRYSRFFVGHGRLLQPLRADELLLPGGLP